MCMDGESRGLGWPRMDILGHFLGAGNQPLGRAHPDMMSAPLMCFGLAVVSSSMVRVMKVRPDQTCTIKKVLTHNGAKSKRCASICTTVHVGTQALTNREGETEHRDRNVGPRIAISRSCMRGMGMQPKQKGRVATMDGWMDGWIISMDGSTKCQLNRGLTRLLIPLITLALIVLSLVAQCTLMVSGPVS